MPIPRGGAFAVSGLRTGASSRYRGVLLSFCVREEGRAPEVQKSVGPEVGIHCTEWTLYTIIYVLRKIV